MNPGKYRHPITFLTKAPGQDDYGEPTDTWTNFATAWAAFDPLLGNEFFSALSVESKVEVKFNSRYVAGVTNDMRIQHDGKTYEILSAINVKGLNRELLCYCKAVD